MKMDFKLSLKEEAKKNGLELTDSMLDKFEIYKDLLLLWNEKINLTAITNEYEIIMKHFIDCLEIVKYIKNGENIIDVGTGAGFPGLVIAIYFEDKVNITLLDALNKRLIFLQEVIEKLHLKNIKIVHGRAEEIARKQEYRECYDIVVSRAVANLTTLLEYDSPYIKKDGICLLMKSSNVDTEIEEAKGAMKILNLKLSNIYRYEYRVSEEKYERNIIEIKKIGNTPNKYPRNYGKMKKEPLK